MKKAMAGLKNTAAAARGKYGQKLGEGKSPIPFELYKALCKWLSETSDTNAAFAHCFLR
jgi:hypothetical protein